MNRATDVQIGSIRVRAEGLTPGQGRELGEQIAVLLAERLPDAGARRDLAYVQVKINAERGAPVGTLAVQVVDSILNGL